MSILEVDNLTVKLPDGADRPFAIEGVSLNVEKGEILCIVGESGSGKSVTAFSVMGLADRRALTPVSGAIKLEGEDILNTTDARLRKLRRAKANDRERTRMQMLNVALEKLRYVTKGRNALEVYHGG